MQDEREACLQAGMDDFLTKPINLSELTLTIKKWAIKNNHQVIQ